MAEVKAGLEEEVGRAAGQTKGVSGKRWNCVVGKMSADLFLRSWNAAASEKDKFRTSRQWKRYFTQRVMSLWNGLSPRGGPGRQCKWITESFGEVWEWQSCNREVWKAEKYIKQLGVQGGATEWTSALCSQTGFPSALL